MFIFAPAITVQDRQRARSIVARGLDAVGLRPKQAALNAGLTASEWSRKMSGEHNVSLDSLVCQPPEAQIEVALAWLEDLGAIPPRRGRALAWASRIKTRMLRATLRETRHDEEVSA